MELKNCLMGITAAALFFVMCILMVVPANAQSNEEVVNLDVSENVQLIAEVDYLNISTQINDGYAITTVEEKLDNTNNLSITDSFEFLIPEKAFISGFSIIIDGNEYKADILKKAEAEQKFEEATGSGRTAGLLETRDSELFSYSLNFKSNQSIIVQLTYEQALTRTLGEYEYLQYLRSNHDVNDLSISVDISSSTNLLSIETPGLESDVTYPTANSAQVRYIADSLPNDDMRVVFKTENTPLNGNMLFYESDGNGYFMHIFSPTAEEIGTSPLNKDIIFVIDKSGSMSGLKIEQVKTAFSQIIGDLSEGDRFNVVFFDSTVEPHSSEILVVNDVNKNQAIETVNSVTADGGTNINDALITSFGMFDNTSENVPIIVFLTDGMPSVGVTSTAVIRENVLSGNRVNASIFSIAFGEENDYDFDFLQALSLENRGVAVYFEPTSEAARGISHFYETISTPLVSNLQFSYSEQVSQTVLTGKDHLFVGSEVITLGKYDPNADSITAKVNGNTRAGEHTFESKFTVQPSNSNEFIARLWAYNTIMNRLDRMKVEGETDALVAEVTNLSLEYGFVTPYTSFFVEVPQAEESEQRQTEPNGEAAQPPTQSSSNVPSSPGPMPTEPASSEAPPTESMEDTQTPGFGFLLAVLTIGGSLLAMRKKK